MYVYPLGLKELNGWDASNSLVCTFGYHADRLSSLRVGLNGESLLPRFSYDIRKSGRWNYSARLAMANQLCQKSLGKLFN